MWDNSARTRPPQAGAPGRRLPATLAVAGALILCAPLAVAAFDPVGAGADPRSPSDGRYHAVWSGEPHPPCIARSNRRSVVPPTQWKGRRS